MQEATLKIGGMSCQGCVRSATQALTCLDGVTEVRVSLEAGEAHVVFDPARQSESGLRAAIVGAGFEVA